MIQFTAKCLSTLQFENLCAQPALLHFVSTRQGGVSRPPYDGLNLAFHVGDRAEDVLENRRRLFGAVGIPLEWLVCAEQVHGDGVAVVTREMRGRGALTSESAVKGSDALVTNEADTCLAILAADCVPVILYDPGRRVVAVAHAGWQGTVRHIAARAARAMSESFGSPPADILAGIGPSIGPADYEVGPDVVFHAKAAYPQVAVIRDTSNGKGYFDLWKANLQDLLDCGIPRKNVELAAASTYQDVQTFYSARRAGTTGRFLTAVMLIA